MRRRSVVALVSIAVLAFASAALAQTRMPIPGPDNSPILEKGPDNSLHVIWLADDGIAEVDVYHYSSGAGATMGDPFVFLGPDDPGPRLRFTVRTDEVACGHHIRYSEDPDGEGVISACWYGDGSDGYFILYQVDVEDFDIQLASDGVDRVLYTVEGQLIMRDLDVRMGGTPVSPEGEVAIIPELVVTPDDGLHAFWSVEDGGGWYVSHSPGDGVTWSPVTSLSESTPALHGRRTGSDSSGRVHSVILTDLGLEYRWWDGESGWSEAVIETIDTDVLHSAMAVSDDGDVVAVLATEEGANVYLAGPDTGWESYGSVPETGDLPIDHLDVTYADRVWVLWHGRDTSGYTLTPLEGTAVDLGEDPAVPVPGDEPLPVDEEPPVDEPPGEDPAGTPGEAAEPPADTESEPLTGWVRSVPSPSQISLDPIVLLVSVALGAMVIFLMPFPAELFDNTFSEHYDEIRGWFRLGNKQRAGPSFWDTGLGLGLFLTACAVLYGFLDPGFGLNTESGPVALGLIIGLVLILLAFEVPVMIMRGRTTGDYGRIKAMPIGLLFGLFCVLISRLTGFLPGYVYALVAGLVFVKTVGDQEEERETVRSVTTLLLIGLVAWFALETVRSVDGAGFAVQVVEVSLAFLVVGAFESLAIGLIPLRELPGRTMMLASKSRWLLTWGISVFAFFHIVINPANGYLTSSALVPLVTTVSLLILFTVISVGLWAYFRSRDRSPV